MKKIMFNDKFSLTKAVIEGRKTQTRRVIPQATIDKIMEVQALYYEATLDKLDGLELFEYYFYFHIDSDKKFPYNIGEVVAVAQSYRDCGGINKDCRPIWNVIAEAKGASHSGWNNKMFVCADLMPHQIRITDVRIERLQDISGWDYLKEGLEWDEVTSQYYVNYQKEIGHKMFLGKTLREAFSTLIDKVSGKGTWERNPYVFVYDFELVKP